MDRFTRVLFQMDAFDPHKTCHAIAHFNQHFTFANDGMVKLGNLIALRQIGIEIVLAIKGTVEVDLRLQAQPCAHGLRDAGFVDHGQHAGHARIHECHV